jgi:integrase
VAKRGNGEGSIRRRKDGRYEGRYTDEAGRQRSVYGKTRKESVARLVAAMKDSQQSIQIPMTIRAFLDEYDAVALDTMRRRGYETYHDIARLHVLPEIGDMRLSDLTRESIQALYRRPLTPTLRRAWPNTSKSTVGRPSACTPRWDCLPCR